MHIELIIRNRNAVFVKGAAHLLLQVEMHVPVILAPAPRPRGYLHRAVAVAADAGKGRFVPVFGDDQRMLLHGFADKPFRKLRVVVVGNREGQIHAALRLLRIIYEPAVHEDTVGDHRVAVIEGTDNGVHHVDIKHRADVAVDLDAVAGRKARRDKQKNPAGDIAQRILEGEGDRRRHRGERGDNARGGNADRVERGDHDEHVQDDVRGLFEKFHKRFVELGAPKSSVEQFYQVFNEEMPDRDDDRRFQKRQDKGQRP